MPYANVQTVGYAHVILGFSFVGYRMSVWPSSLDWSGYTITVCLPHEL
jgi:hypothetical protein